MKYGFVCDEDVARVTSHEGKVLVEIGRTCPYCGKMCEIELFFGGLKRTCKRCKEDASIFIAELNTVTVKEWEHPVKR
jgi:hypothetical protein